MRPRTSAFYVLAFTLAGLLVMGCDSTGTSSEDPSPDEEGAVSFSLVPTANSDVPSDADSAFVRVWKPEGSFNLVEFVNIPDPGQQTEVSLSVPADNGYRTGVLSVKSETPSSPEFKSILAHGSSSLFSVDTGGTSRVDLNVRSAEVTLERPESLAPNQVDTIAVTLNLNVPGLNEDIRGFQSSNSDFNVFDGETLEDVRQLQQTDTTSVQRFEIQSPNVDSEDTTYVKFATRPLRDDSLWRLSGYDFGFTFFPSESGPSFEIPVVPESDGNNGNIIITFSKDEDGWEKTRRVVE